MASSNPGWWRWVVMCSCTLCLFLGGSQTFSCGVFHVALLEHFQQDAVLTAWLGSLFASMFALSGPIASFVVNVTSYRSCSMLGSLLILVGFTLSAFITDMRWLFLTYSVLAGLGEGLVYLGSIVAFSMYFPGQVSMASGVGMAGLSLGVFVFPPLAQFLLDEYGLQGCFLLIGAAGFQSAVFGALLRPCTVEITDGTEIKDTEIQGTEIKYTDTQGTEIKDTEKGFSEIKNTDIQGPEIQGRDIHGTEKHGTEIKDTEKGFSEIKNTDIQGPEIQGRDIHGTEKHGTEIKDKEIHGTEIHGTELKIPGDSLCRRILNYVLDEKGCICKLVNPSFLLFLVSVYCMGGSVYVNYLYLPDFWIKHGSTATQASFFFTVAGAGGVMSRVLAGFAANDSNIGPLVMYAGSYGIAALMHFFIIPINATTGGKIGYSLMFGVYCSTGWVLLSPITMIIVGKKNFTSALGVVMLFCGLGALTVPPLTGLIGEHFGGYRIIFSLAGSCSSCTSLLAFLLMFLSRPQRPSSKEEEILRSEVLAIYDVHISDETEEQSREEIYPMLIGSDG